MERVMGIALTASQAVIHVLLRDLTNYYYHKEMMDTNRLCMMALQELEPPAKTYEKLMPSIISNKDNYRDNYGNEESKTARGKKEELTLCNRFISYENQENCRNEDIIGAILNDKTSLLAENNQHCCANENNESNNQTEFSSNTLETKVDNKINAYVDIELLSNEEHANTQTSTKEMVNTTPSTPNSTIHEKSESQYYLSELFSNFNASAKSMLEYDSEISFENGFLSSDKYVEENNNKVEKEEKPCKNKICHQSTECHPCILEDFLEPRWSSEESLDKLSDDQCVPEFKDVIELNSSTIKEPVDENNNIINENASQNSGIIEGFSDIESSCYDEEWVERLIAEINGEQIKMEKTDESVTLGDEEDDVKSLKNESDFHECGSNKTYNKDDKKNCDCCNVHSCLQVVDWDEECELLTEEQLRSVETGSVSDWLYTVRPAGCWLSADNVIQVSPEELRGIDNDMNQAIEDTIVKKLFVHKWLENMSMYCDPSLKYACGDY